MIIPDVLVIGILVLTLIYKGVNYLLYGITANLLYSLGGMFIAGGMFLAILILSGGGMGDGDVTLIGALGFVLGIKYILLTVFLSFVIGAIISIFLLITKIKTRKDPIPFGPLIILGFFITVLLGEELINLYIDLLF